MPTDTKRPILRGRWLAAASLGVSLAVTWGLLAASGVSLRVVVGAIPPWVHVLAVAAFTTELLARGVRVWSIARGLALPVSLRTSVSAQLSGDALAAVTPSRVGSDPAKLAVLRRGGVGLGQAGALLLGEMALEALVLAVAGVLVAVSDPGRWWLALGVAGYALVVAATGGLSLWAAGRSAASPPRVWRLLRLSVARWGALREAARDFRCHAAGLLRIPRRHLASALVATLVHIGARVALFPILLLSAGDIAGPAAADAFLRPFFVLYATALLPPPGGGGAVEVAFAAVLGGALPATVLSAMLVWWRLYTFHLGALAGWAYLGASLWRHPKILDTGPSPEGPSTFSGLDAARDSGA